MKLLGVHFIPTHTGSQHWDYIRSVQPGVMKIVGSGFPDVQLLSDAYANAPGAVHIWRDHALSEQHADLWASPGQTGRRHAAEMVRHAEEAHGEAEKRGLTLPPRDHVKMEGINEPVLELFPRNEDMTNYDEWRAMVQERAALLDEYMLAFGEGVEAPQLGYGAIVGNFSTGQPPNRVPGEYATFAWFPETKKFLERGKRSWLGVHEYWPVEGGPESVIDWHVGRFMHLAVDCRICTTEAGAVRGYGHSENYGYVGLLDAAGYADQHRRYIMHCQQDPRWEGETPFTLDGGKRWESFYLEFATAEFAAMARQLPDKHVINVPIVFGDPGPAPLPTGALDPAVVLAILDVEASGHAFGPNGRLIIRFEAHIFKDQLQDDAAFDKLFQIADTQPWQAQQWLKLPGGVLQPIHTGSQASEWQALLRARDVDIEAANRSASMGIAQIMGFNAERLGYASATAMFDQLAQSEAAQILGCVNFILTSPQLLQAVKARDWRAIAKYYNGNNVDVYAPRLEAAYEKRKATT